MNFSIIFSHYRLYSLCLQYISLQNFSIQIFVGNMQTSSLRTLKKSITFFWNFLNSNFQVPPTIDDAMSNSDVIVREGSDLSFTCHARGSPTPTVKWRREDGRKISFNKSYSGEFIEIFIEIFNEELRGAVD